MIIEYAQLLSTAHRVLDGTIQTFKWTDTVYDVVEGVHRERARVKKLYILDGESPYVQMENHSIQVFEAIISEIVGHVEIIGRKCYNATHINHPCALWARESSANYQWLFALFTALLGQYTIRYEKTHAAAALKEFLRTLPKNIKVGDMTPFAMAMPEQYKVENNVVLSYQNFYVQDKVRFAKWPGRIPEWFADRVPDAARLNRAYSILEDEN